MTPHDNNNNTDNISYTGLQIEGMTCTNCALAIDRYLQKQGVSGIKINFATGEALFTSNQDTDIEKISKGIEKLGYRVVGMLDDNEDLTEEDSTNAEATTLHTADMNLTPGRLLFVCAVLCLPLVAAMFLPFPFLHNPLLQTTLSLPVLLAGIYRFGPSAWGSLRGGVPNMYVLILMGAVVAFVYSLLQASISSAHSSAHHFYFETTAVIITLALLGKWLEHIAIQKTTSAIDDLKQLQQVTAKKIVANRDNNAETICEIPASKLRKNDLVQLNLGDRVPTDGVVWRGTGLADEAMISGESEPVFKQQGSPLIGGTIVHDGNFQMKVTATGKQTTLAQIITLVRDVQSDKPPIQRIADRVSSVFVPAILGVALLTFGINYMLWDITFRQSLINAVAVLVVACPCAMGLSVPTALVTAVGRAAKRGIVIKGADTIEILAGLKSVIFDKTGTLTTGKFALTGMKTFDGFDQNRAMSIVRGIEQHSTHPLAQSLQAALADYPPHLFQSVTEQKGVGMTAVDTQRHRYQLGNYSLAQHLSQEAHHTLYLLTDDRLVAALDMADDLKPDAAKCVGELHAAGIQTLLLSGDRQEKCEQVGRQVGIGMVHAAQLPAGKLQVIEQQKTKGLCAMVGDGINDAPALAKADVGISLGGATQVAIQSAKVVLLNDQLTLLPYLLSLSKKTLQIIRQNLFWAFFYNVLMIPLAASGRLDPMMAAGAMALSSLLVVANSLRLRWA